LDDFGNVNVHYGGVEMGQGLHSVLTLAVAEALGVTPDQVFINQTDTATCPWDVGTHASRGSFVSCNAAILAANELRARIFKEAEKIFPREIARNLEKHRQRHPDEKAPDFDFAGQSRADNFELRDGVISLKNAPAAPWATIELGRLLRAIHFRRGGDVLAAQAFYDPPTDLPDWEKGYGNLSATYTFGTQGVEVEVDTQTGVVKILNFVNALDIGKALNPQTLKGQIYGGIAQGIGYALYEEIREQQGRILNPGFTDYKIPTTGEMDFPIQLEFVETDDKFGPFGAKGVGEPALVPTAPAIANAIYDAVGVRIFDLPITPEKVLQALQQKRDARR
ncbi:MAG: molybdopterin-dependent oxidoreductase, partial [Deltaproteobacteria bacterium]|nr:molybdopterin-dependent oxidoreductase [Deltaproteobacteria bacterium]